MPHNSNKFKFMLEKFRYLKILLVSSILALIFTIIYFQTNVPLDSQPYGYWSAKRLAGSIARLANCHDLEYLNEEKDYAIFSCQKDISSFSIWVFYDKAIKNKHVSDFSSIKEWNIFKTGSFYIVLESITYGHINTKKDFDDFTGEIVMPSKTQ